MPTHETPLVRQIQKAIRRRWPDAWVFKVVGSPYQESGVPDLLVLVEGVFLGLEVKHRKPGESEERARGRATPLQRNQIGKIRRAGGTAEVVLSTAEALKVIEWRLAENEEPSQ